MRKVALVAVLLALVGLGVFWLTLDTRRAGPASAEAVKEGAAVDASELADAGRVPEPGAPLSVKSERAIRPVPARPEEKAKVAPTTRSLAGTIVVVDEMGNEHDAEGGQFALVLGGERRL